MDLLLNHRIAHANGASMEDLEPFRRLVGRLIYLGVTRPDLACSVHILSQFMQAPRVGCPLLESNPGSGYYVAR